MSLEKLYFTEIDFETCQTNRQAQIEVCFLANFKHQFYYGAPAPK